jgi:predicted MFS family arabinose efflux permease
MMEGMSAEDASPASTNASRASASRRAVTLTILLSIFATNFMDRQIVAILVEPIKRDLILSDTEVGLLYGLAFAVLYTSAGIPIARFADRVNRARIINWSLVLFSVMTAACGLATSYWQFLVARIGVAIGEGGTNPPSHSMISDLYPVSRRSTAMAIFSLGPHIGILLGFLIGGWVAQLWGWRSAFLIAGLGGLVLAALSFRFLHEPKRGWADGTGVGEQPPGRAVVQSFVRQASLRHLLAGAAVFTIAAYAVVGWLPSFLIRSHGLSTGTAGSILALVLGLVGGFGTVLGGLLADRLGARNPRWRLRTVAIALVVVSFFWAAVFLTRDSVTVLIFLVLPGGLLGFYLGPTFAMVQSLVDPAMRAMAAAFLLLVINIAGLGLGPIAVGSLSDALLVYFGADSLRMALLVVPPLCIRAAYHYHAAARAIAFDLSRAHT